jgi:hypothetical protein
MASSADLEPGDGDTRGLKSQLRASTAEEARDIDRGRRSDKTNEVLVDADRRDTEAAARDAVADERERVADRQSFTDPGAPYTGHRAMRDAALDRRDAKRDRESSAEDRVQLAEDNNSDVSEGPVMGASADEPNTAEERPSSGR